jgi:hypothetical protein
MILYHSPKNQVKTQRHPCYSVEDAEHFTLVIDGILFSTIELTGGRVSSIMSECVYGSITANIIPVLRICQVISSQASVERPAVANFKLSLDPLADC